MEHKQGHADDPALKRTGKFVVVVLYVVKSKVKNTLSNIVY